MKILNKKMIIISGAGVMLFIGVLLGKIMTL